MLKKDKQSLMLICLTILFIISVALYMLTSPGLVNTIAQVLSILFGSMAVASFFITRLHQQRYLSHVLHGMVRSQTKLLNEFEQLKAKNPGASDTQGALDAENEMMKAVILELAKARGENLEEIQIPEPTNENIEVGEMGELILLDDPHEQPHQKEQSYASLDRQELLFEVKEALKMDRIEVLLQPVVSLPQRKPRFYECFSRLRAEDNSILVPHSYLEVAEHEGLISAVDNALLFRCIQMVRKAKKRHVDIGFFCNVSSASLADENFIESFIEFIEANPELKPWLILEVKENAIYSQDPKVQKALKKIAKVNCTFSLDQLESLDLDTDVLKGIGVKFVKINSDQLVVKDNEAYEKLQALRKKLESLRIDVIATKIENEARVKDILDFNVDYGQGYLFSAPRISRI